MHVFAGFVSRAFFMMMVMLVLATVVVALVVMVVRVMLSFLHETSVYAQELLCCVFQLSVPSCRERQL